MIRDLIATALAIFLAKLAEILFNIALPLAVIVASIAVAYWSVITIIELNRSTSRRK